MRFVRSIPEEEMVAHFLQTEIRSVRFGNELRRLLESIQLDSKVVEQPDLNNPLENLHRAELLGEFRGYRRDEAVFKGVPDDVHWWRAILGTADLEKTKYINDDYWIEFSGGSRLVIDAAKRIHSGEMPEVAEGYLSLVRALEQGARFPELILLYNPMDDDLVVLEGHMRITVYMLYLQRLDALPSELPALVGCSDLIEK